VVVFVCVRYKTDEGDRITTCVSSVCRHRTGRIPALT